MDIDDKFREEAIRVFNKKYNVKPPKDENTKIWRYMDFSKFMSIIENESLFFARGDTFEDKFEGAITGKNAEVYEKMIDWCFNTVSKKFGNIPDTLKKDILIKSREQMQKLKQYNYINCWHINEYESEAMWKLYSSNNQSVAIQTTYKRLQKSLKYEGHDIHIGVIDYIDHSKELVQTSSMYDQFFYKRRSFEHEKELRALITENPKSDFISENPKIGLNVPIDIILLIENIYISPTAPGWFYELIKNIIARYKYKFNIIQSSLNDEPIY